MPTPTVRAFVGTLDKSLSKNLAFAIIVSCARVFMRVRETKLEPGSLKAICPSGPIPIFFKSQINIFDILFQQPTITPHK